MRKIISRLKSPIRKKYLVGSILILLLIHSVGFLNSSPVAGEMPDSLIIQIKDSVETATDPALYKVVSDPDREIKLVIFQLPYTMDIFFMDFIEQARPEIQFVGIVKDRQAAQEIWKNLNKQHIKDLNQRLKFLVVEKGQNLTQWGRDPYLVSFSPKKKKYALIPSFKENSFRFKNTVDRQVLSSLVKALLPVPVVKADFGQIESWFVEGGAVTSDQENVYIGREDVRLSRLDQNDNYVVSKREVLDSLELITGKKAIVIPSIDPHSDMMHMPVGKTKFGERTSLLADPVKTLEIIMSMTTEEKEKVIKNIENYSVPPKLNINLFNRSNIQEGSHVTTELIQKKMREFLNVNQAMVNKMKKSLQVKLLNEAEVKLKSRGIAVVRVPGLIDQYLILNDDESNRSDPEKLNFFFGVSYLNVVQDGFGTQRSVFIPQYGIKKLDQYAKDIYSSLDCFDQVHQIRSLLDSIGVGGVRCRVQVLAIPLGDRSGLDAKIKTIQSNSMGKFKKLFD